MSAPRIHDILVQTNTKPQDTLKSKSKLSPKKISLFIVAIALFVLGYTLAPAPISEGSYNVELSYKESSVEFVIHVDDGLQKAQLPQKLFLVQGSFNLTADYYEYYPGIAGTIFSFSLNISTSNSTTLSINDFKGKISGNGAKYEFFARTISETTTNFEFKILRDTRVVMGLLFGVSFMWLTEVIPLGATALIIPVVLVFTKIDTAKNSLAPFADPIIFLFLAGFLMAEGMKKSKLDQFISFRLIAAIPPNGKLLMLSFMFLTAGFSMFMSNTAAVAVFIPLALQLLKGLDEENAEYKRAVVLGIAYAATIGGIGSLIGTPPNVIAAEFLANYDESIQISFVDWFLFGLPIVILMIPLTFLYLWLRFKPKVEHRRLVEAKTYAKIRIQEENKMNLDQTVVSLVFALVFGLWLTSEIHGISASIVAMLGAFLLFLTGQIEEEDFKKINWNALLTFGGGLTLGFTLLKTGLADFIGTKLIGLRDLPVFFIIMLIGLTGLILTAFASNTSSAVILIPIVIPLGPILGINPIILALSVAIIASIDFAIVIGTPPTMMAYSTGLYKVKEIFKIGIVLDIVGLVVSSIVAYLLFDNLLVYV